MVVEKCKYYNDARTAVVLMIDDLAPVAVTTDGKITPANDWGYLFDKENSLYAYLERTLFNDFPEIRGTFFIPLKSHLYLDDKKGYVIYKKDFDEEFGKFAERIKNRFDFAFHGIAHTYLEQPSDEGTLRYEFQHLTREDIPRIRKEMETFTGITGVTLTGGKYPGNRGNECSEKIIGELGFQWWTHRKMFNVRDPHKMECSYIGEKENIVDIPQTFMGDAFNPYLHQPDNKNNLLKLARNKLRMLLNEKRLVYLYEHGIPITIQEHFQNATTSGKRQRPNIFDDITSITRIYNILRGGDIWYATANEMAAYVNTAEKTIIKNIDHESFELDIKATGNNSYLCIKSGHREMVNTDSGQTITGRYVNGRYIFDMHHKGKYKICR
jgi:hypothetical protein